MPFDQQICTTSFSMTMCCQESRTKTLIQRQFGWNLDHWGAVQTNNTPCEPRLWTSKFTEKQDLSAKKYLKKSQVRHKKEKRCVFNLFSNTCGANVLWISLTIKSHVGTLWRWRARPYDQHLRTLLEAQRGEAPLFTVDWTVGLLDKDQNLEYCMEGTSPNQVLLYF